MGPESITKSLAVFQLTSDTAEVNITNADEKEAIYPWQNFQFFFRLIVLCECVRDNTR